MGFLLSTERLSTVVDGYYQHLLGRSLDPSGKAYWVGILQAGGRNEAIIGGIIASIEYWNKTATTAYTWGYNAYGQLGDGTTTDRPTPEEWSPTSPGPGLRPAVTTRWRSRPTAPCGRGASTCMASWVMAPRPTD